MKNVTKEILGFKVPVVGVVETLDEAVIAAGSAEAVVNDFNSNVLAHSHYTILRRKFCKELEKLTGIKRLGETTGEGEAAKFKVTEKEEAYVTRLETELGEETLQSFLKDLIAVSEATPVDYKPGVRGSGASDTPAKKWLAYYDQMVKEDKLDRFCARHGINRELPEEDLKIEVANKAKELVTAQQAAAAKQAMEV